MPKFSRDKELKSYLCPGASFFVHFPAFRTLFLGEQDNFIHLPADHAEKPLISVDFYRPKCVDRRYLFL